MTDRGVLFAQFIKTCRKDPQPSRLLDVYTHLERHMNDGSPSGFKVEIPEPYSPLSKADSFPLPFFETDRFNLIQIGDLPGAWSSAYSSSELLPMPIHPLFAEKLVAMHPTLPRSPRFSLDVTPTSSGRTVLYRGSQNDDAHFLKLHYPATIGRFSRDLRLFQWLAGLEVSRELYGASRFLPRNAAFLHEFGGLYLEGAATVPGFGVIFRDVHPTPRLAGPRVLIPAFSLFAGTKNVSPQDSLLAQLLREVSNPVEACLSMFVSPLIETFFVLALDYGLIPECNAQNVLYEVDLRTLSTRVVLRDLGDFFKDLAKRRTLGLHTAFCSYKCIEPARDDDLYKRRSFAFDFKLSQYVLAPILEALCEHTGRSVQDVAERVRAVVSASLREDGYFGDKDTWYAYPSVPSVGRDAYEQRRDPLFR